MKKIILLIFVGFLLWIYAPIISIGSTNHSPSELSNIKNSEALSARVDEIQVYQCDGRQYCSQMGSYEEAKYFIENCPKTKMDGDNDGIPCERQFNRYD